MKPNFKNIKTVYKSSVQSYDQLFSQINRPKMEKKDRILFITFISQPMKAGE